MQRLALEKLIKWKSKKKHKPLILQGARQVGKTWLMREFGKTNFKQTIYVNFEINKRVIELFKKDLDIKRIIFGLEAEFNVKIIPEDTLIIFDEIQELPTVITSLKYFYEEMPQLYIISAGSLLGVALHKGVSYPVGKVETMSLYPMSFKEFLYALNENRLVDLMEMKDFDLIKTFKNKLTDYLKQYFYIGGMPEVVEDFVINKDITTVRTIQKEILNAYQNDFSKHAPKEIFSKLMLIWNQIPAQLSKENKKFIYKDVVKNSRAKDFEDAIMWLIQSGLVYKISRVSKPGLPISAYLKENIFKLFILDTGLLCAKSGLEPKEIIDGDKLFTEFKGALAEQYVLQQLKNIEDLEIAYWANDDTGIAEIDFLVQYKGQLIPMEVKSKTNLKAKSLKSYREKFKPKFAIRTSLSDYKQTDNLIDLPLYCIEESKSEIE